MRLLQEGARRGLISTRLFNGLPLNIWAVTGNGVALEAHLENNTQGTCHGYPVLEADPFRNTIVRRWGEEWSHARGWGRRSSGLKRMMSRWRQGDERAALGDS